MGLFFAPVANVLLSSVRPEEEGQASGAGNAIRELGGVFGVAVLAAVFTRNGGFSSPQAFVDGMVPAILIGAAFVGLGAVAAFAIPRTRRVTAEQPEFRPPALRAPWRRATRPRPTCASTSSPGRQRPLASGGCPMGHPPLPRPAFRTRPVPRAG